MPSTPNETSSSRQQDKCEVCDYENAVRVGRAEYVCPKCGYDCSIGVFFYNEATGKYNEPPLTNSEWEKKEKEWKKVLKDAIADKVVECDQAFERGKAIGREEVLRVAEGMRQPYDWYATLDSYRVEGFNDALSSLASHFNHNKE